MCEAYFAHAGLLRTGAIPVFAQKPRQSDGNTLNAYSSVKCWHTEGNTLYFGLGRKAVTRKWLRRVLVSLSGFKELFVFFNFEKQKKVSEPSWTKVYLFYLFRVRATLSVMTLDGCLNLSWSSLSFSDGGEQTCEVRWYGPCTGHVGTRVPITHCGIAGFVVSDSVPLWQRWSTSSERFHNSLKVIHRLWSEQVKIRFRAVCLYHQHPFFLRFGADL